MKRIAVIILTFSSLMGVSIKMLPCYERTKDVSEPVCFSGDFVHFALVKRGASQDESMVQLNTSFRLYNHKTYVAFESL